MRKHCSTGSETVISDNTDCVRPETVESLVFRELPDGVRNCQSFRI
ncbi:MAG: hypothetical protein LBS16_02925 [Prevotellaceae bacterium]|jgi:hypothetical protein|nr:hypothetical protein [Prevotellaceae bacterium]